MARLFTDGAESGDTLRWSTIAGTSIVSIRKRTGNYSYNAGDGAGSTKVLAAGVTEFYLRFAVLFTATTANPFFRWYNGAGLAGSLRTKTFGNDVATVAMYDGTTLRATSSTFTMLINEWHVFEVRVKIHASTGIFQVKFDGTLVLDFTGATDAQAQVDRINFVSTAGNDTTDIDDIALNDTAGGVDDGWIADGGVLAALVPSGVGNYTDLIASAGNAWDCVNEIPQNSDTDYVYESIVDKKSTYTLTDVAGIPTGGTIKRVWVELAAKETAADGVEIATVLRSATTDATGADQVLTIAYARYISAEYLVDPADSAAWTDTKLNALEAGAKVR